jgi:hypothetical protein
MLIPLLWPLNSVARQSGSCKSASALLKPETTLHPANMSLSLIHSFRHHTTNRFLVFRSKARQQRAWIRTGTWMRSREGRMEAAGASAPSVGASGNTSCAVRSVDMPAPAPAHPNAPRCDSSGAAAYAACDGTQPRSRDTLQRTHGLAKGSAVPAGDAGADSDQWPGQPDHRHHQQQQHQQQQHPAQEQSSAGRSGTGSAGRRASSNFSGAASVGSAGPSGGADGGFPAPTPSQEALAEENVMLTEQLQVRSYTLLT